MKTAHAINPHISVFIEGQNLNDEVLWDYQGGNSEWPIGDERYGATWRMGLSKG